MKKVIAVVIILIILVVIGMLFYFSQKEKMPEIVKVGYKTNAVYLPFLVALEKGYFSEEGIDVEPVEFVSTNQMIETLVAGRIDATGGSTNLQVLSSVEQRTPGQFKIYMTFTATKDNYADYIIVKQDSSITDLAELKGQKIGIFPGSVNQILIKMILDDYMNVEEDITVVELSPSLQLLALAAGEVEALFTLEPIPSIGEEKGISKVLVEHPALSHVMDPLPLGASILSIKFVNEHPKIAKRFKKAMYKAVDFIDEEETEAKKVLTKYIKLSESTASRMNILKCFKLKEINKVAIQEFVDIFYQEEILEERVDISNLFYEE